MLSVTRLIPALLVCSLVASSALAEELRDPRQEESSRLPSTKTEIPKNGEDEWETISLESLLDDMYDYEVWVAPDVTSETEWVIWGRMDDGQWEEVHEIKFTGTADRPSWSDMGVWKFTTEYAATQKAEDLLDVGKITDYMVIEQDKQPSWTLEETFDTLVEAEDFADDFEDWSQQFGAPHITDIRPVMTNDIFTAPMKSSLMTTR